MKLHGFIFLLASLIIFQSCSDDNGNAPIDPEEIDETNTEIEVSEVITNLTADASKTWKIDNARLIKANGNNVNVTSLYNIQDDEFILTPSTTNTAVNIHWKRGYDVITDAVNQEEARSDMRLSADDLILTIDKTENGIETSTVSNRIQGTYDPATNSITANIKYTPTSPEMEVTLRPKVGADYERPATVASAPVALFSFNSGVFRVGFKISPATNSLIVTNRDDLTGIGSQQAFKYNLETSDLQEIEFTIQDFATKQIEFVNGKIASIGGNVFQSFEYPFTEDPIQYQLDNGVSLINIGSAAQDNTIYVFGGVAAPSTVSEISSFTLGASSLDFEAALPSFKNNADGELLDNKLYIFGGYEDSSSYYEGSSEMFIYDLTTRNVETRTLPTRIIDAYTSIVGNLIYVGGRKPFDSSGDGTFNSYTPFLGIYNTLDDSFSEVNLNLLIPSEEFIVHLQVGPENAYLVTSEFLQAGAGLTNRVYKLDLE